jgi:hypothetical protein
MSSIQENEAQRIWDSEEKYLREFPTIEMARDMARRTADDLVCPIRSWLPAVEREWREIAKRHDWVQRQNEKK